jgi:chemotaxis protein MotA
MAGGHIHALIHPSEFITIGGAAGGAMLISSPKKVIMDIIKGVMATLKGAPFTKATYAELFKLLYAIAKLVRRDGMVALDSHISNPGESPLFKKFPKIESNHHVRDFVCTALTQIVDGKADSGQIIEALEQEIAVIDREHHAAVAALSKTSDALPGFGIVAAVLGIVVTMGAIDGPASEIGHKVGAALVGTFLGILMSYGFVAPLAGRMEVLGEQEMTFFRAIISGVVAINEGASPKDVIIRAKRSIGTDVKPSPNELTEIYRDAEAA